MAPVSTIELKKQAIKAGMNRADARSADRAQLMDFLSDERKPVAKKKVSKNAPVKKKPVAKKKAVARKPVRKAVTKPAPSKPGRKPARKPAPAKNGNGNVGRAAIGKVDYSVESDAWKPRAGSPVELIWKSLKRHRDNVEKVFTELRAQLDKFVEPNSRTTGVKKTKAEKEATLRYRINRTRFEYAVRTGQHESGTDRVEYGTGDYAQAKKKPARKPATTRKAPTGTTRKPARTRKPTTRKRVARR